MKVSVHFSLAPGKSSDLPIRMRVSYEGIRLDLRTGLVCPPGKWSGERMKPGCINRYGEASSDVNSALSDQESAVLRILRRYEIDGSVPSSATLKKEFDEAMGRKVRESKSGDSLSEVFRSYVKTNSSSSWSAGTTRTMVYFLSVLKCYDIASRAVAALSVSDMEDWLQELIDSGLENKTIKGYVTFVKASLRWARSVGRYDGNLPEVFMPRLKGIGMKDVHYLDWSEFERIYNLSLSSDLDVGTRDAFCLCCATGLRVSDCLSLRWSNVRLDADTPFLSVIAKKTKKATIVELNKYSLAILSRRKGSAVSEVVFPEVLYYGMRSHLRSIAKMAGIDRQVRMMSFSGTKDKEEYKPVFEVISSHWGRHTFIVRALALGIAPTTIMAWTGHSSYDAMKPYVAIVDQTKKDSMSRFDM